MGKSNHGMGIGGIIALSAAVSAATAVATYFVTKKIIELQEEKYYDAFCDGNCEDCDDEECKNSGCDAEEVDAPVESAEEAADTEENESTEE